MIVNPSIVVGAGDWNLSSAAMFKSAHKGIKYYTDGGNAFVDVRDVSGNMNALTHSDIAGERFLLTSETSNSRTSST